MNSRVIGVLAAVFLLTPASASAQQLSFGPFYGYRFGGELENTATGESLRIKENPSYGVYLDIDPADSGLRFELLYSVQETEVDLHDLTEPGLRDLDVHVFQVGGLQELWDGRFRPYIAGYVGATWFDLHGLDDDLRFSFTIAAGANYYLTKNLGVRLDVRGFGTVVESSGGLICADGGCVVNYRGDVMWQGEASASVFLAF